MLCTVELEWIFASSECAEMKVFLSQNFLSSTYELGLILGVRICETNECRKAKETKRSTY